MIFRLVSAKSKNWAEIWVKPFFLQKFDLSVPVRQFIIFEIFISLYLLKKFFSQAVLADLNKILLTICFHNFFYHFSEPLKNWRRPRRQPQNLKLPLLHLRLRLPQRHRRLPSQCKRPHLVLEASDKVSGFFLIWKWMRIKKSLWKLIYKSVMIVLFHKVRTSALLITDPTPQPMTSTATMAAAAVS